jgi:hypothetical protein
MPRLVRKKPLLQRIRDRLDPWDLWDELTTSLDIDSYAEAAEGWAVPIGFCCNICFMFAKLGSRPGLGRSGNDDVFGDVEGKRGPGWFGWIVRRCIAVIT